MIVLCAHAADEVVIWPRVSRQISGPVLRNAKADCRGWRTGRGSAFAARLHLLRYVACRFHPAFLSVSTNLAPNAAMVCRRSTDKCSGMTSTMR